MIEFEFLHDMSLTGSGDRQTLANRLVRNICKKQVQFDFKCFLGNGNGHSESDTDTAMYTFIHLYNKATITTYNRLNILPDD